MQHRDSAWDLNHTATATERKAYQTLRLRQRNPSLQRSQAILRLSQQRSPLRRIANPSPPGPWLQEIQDVFRLSQHCIPLQRAAGASQSLQDAFLEARHFAWLARWVARPVVMVVPRLRSADSDLSAFEPIRISTSTIYSSHPFARDGRDEERGVRLLSVVDIRCSVRPETLEHCGQRCHRTLDSSDGGGSIGGDVGTPC